jgi:DNA-binding NarL/FixJ family response regulator
MRHAAHPLALVALAARGETGAARERASEVLATPDLPDARRAIILATVAFSHYLDCDFTHARLGSEHALEVARRSGDDEALLHALSMAMLASAGDIWGADDPVEDYFVLAWNLKGTLDRLDTESRLVALHLLAEGALATGRITEALAVHDELGDIRSERDRDEERREPFPVFMLLQRARILLFAGEMNRALEVLDVAAREAEERGQDHLVLLSESFRGLALAHLGERGVARAVTARIAEALPAPRGLLDTGCWIVCAFALNVIGDRERAAACVLTAGGGPDLAGIQLVDRALGYDILVGSALERDDLEDAADWGARSLGLAAHPAASAVTEQILARLDQAQGDTESAAHRARVAAARSRLTGRYLDAARADLIEARALAASGQPGGAVQRLTSLAHEASRAGVVSLRQSANKELRALGRRLGPLPGSGWEALGERERQIALLAAEGFSNRVIGSSLFLSERTVQTYMSRVLIAFGATSRTALPHLIGSTDTSSTLALPPLTARQWDVARLVSDGLSNREIAARLGISVKTAENHLSEIFGRWGVDSRTGVARAMLRATRRPTG